MGMYMIDIYTMMRKWYLKKDFDILLKKKKLKQVKIAKALGIGENTITRLKKAGESHHPDTLEMVAKFMKMKIEWDDEVEDYYFYEEDTRESSADWVDDVEEFYNPKKEKRRNHKKPCVKSLVRYANKLEQGQILELIKYIEYRYNVKETIEPECVGKNNNLVMNNH